jgi:osmotically inducible protein OsmC
MPTRTANAVWKGKIKDGSGEIQLGSGHLSAPYSFASRFESGEGTNPEELIGAAEAGCFSMAFSLMLEQEGHPPEQIESQAAVTIDQQGGGFAITKVEITMKARVPGIDEDAFQRIATQAKENCPVSKALAGTTIDLTATLEQ